MGVSYPGAAIPLAGTKRCPKCGYFMLRLPLASGTVLHLCTRLACQMQQVTPAVVAPDRRY